jgi:hypothetical protein
MIVHQCCNNCSNLDLVGSRGSTIRCGKFSWGLFYIKPWLRINCTSFSAKTIAVLVAERLKQD